MNKWNIFLVLTILLFQGCSLNHQIVSNHIKSLEDQAKAGDIQSQYELGSAYDTGIGAPRDGHEAKKWYIKAAEQGHTEAQNSLGSIYQAEHSYQSAMSWYEKAAEKNHDLAINNLGSLYDLGLSVAQDRKKGVELYLRAATLGSAEAMFNMANKYGQGHVEQNGHIDNYNAYVWCLRAGKYANPAAIELNDKTRQCIKFVKTKLSEKQFSEGKKEAFNWSPSSK
ncbi:MAG: hypothetical protein COA95_08815 [Methylophaga sp.]|nr:MAG: hypothetical protein COA95_08815 [Methylophaga sp.]